jgi:hypothetical protein
MPEDHTGQATTPMVSAQAAIARARAQLLTGGALEPPRKRSPATPKPDRAPVATPPPSSAIRSLSTTHSPAATRPRSPSTRKTGGMNWARR